MLAKFTREKLNAGKVVTLIDVKQDYSVDLAKFFKDEFSKLGGKIIGEQSYSTGDTDFRAQLTSIRAAQPDVVCVRFWCKFQKRSAPDPGALGERESLACQIVASGKRQYCRTIYRAWG